MYSLISHFPSFSFFFFFVLIDYVFVYDACDSFLLAEYVYKMQV